MILNINQLVLWGGFLCIRSIQTATDKPEFIIHYWPIFPCNEGLVKGFDYPVGHRMRRLSAGSYTCADSSDNRVFELEKGGQTQSIEIQTLPCLQPKLRTETRWYYGCWQKYLKREGWVDLPFDLAQFKFFKLDTPSPNG